MEQLIPVVHTKLVRVILIVALMMITMLAGTWDDTLVWFWIGSHADYERRI